MKLQKLFLTALLLPAIIPAANAFTYKDGDLLLVFRKDGFDDVLFNTGSVSNLTSLSAGQKVVISNWKPELVDTAFGTDWSDGVKFILLATTPLDDSSRRAWLSNGEPETKPADRTASQWQGLWSKINAVGSRASQITETNSEPSFVTSSSAFHSYSYVVSNGGIAQSQIPKLGGSSTFTVETSPANDLSFYEIKPSTALPKPESKLLGTFHLSNDHILSFQAPGGSVPVTATNIRGISANANSITVSFETVAGLKYRLRRASSLPSTTANWTSGTEVVDGTGNPASLSEVISGPAGFYQVESFQ